jgi:hypothetical protein
MRKLVVLLLLWTLALAAEVPVSSLALVPGLLWPAPTWRVLGEACERAVAELAPTLPEGKELAEAQCYRWVADPKDAATYLYFLARGLSEAGFRLVSETMPREGTLVQVWENGERRLYLGLRFGEEGVFVVAGWLEPIGG